MTSTPMDSVDNVDLSITSPASNSLMLSDVSFNGSASGSMLSPTGMLSRDTTLQARVQTELEEYLSMDRVKAAKEQDLYHWEPVASFWSTYESRMPLLAELARKHLATPISSVYSERLFSEFGQVYEQKRKRLKPSTASGLLFIHHNLHKADQYKIEAQIAEKAKRKNLGLDFSTMDPFTEPRDWSIKETETDAMHVSSYRGIYSPEFAAECEYVDESEELGEEKEEDIPPFQSSSASVSRPPFSGTQTQTSASASRPPFSGTQTQTSASASRPPISDPLTQTSASGSRPPFSDPQTQTVAPVDVDETSNVQADANALVDATATDHHPNQSDAEGQDQPAAEGQDQPAAERQDQPAAERQDQPATEEQDQPAAEKQDQVQNLCAKSGE